MATTDEQRIERRRRGTGAAVTLGGLAVLAAAGVTVWSWRSELPDPVASHWGAGGRPDGFSSVGGIAGVLLGMGAGLVLLFGGATWGLGRSAVNRRIGAGATTWVSLFLSTLLVGTLSVQRGLSDARETPGVGGVLLAAGIGSMVISVIVAIAVPGDPRVPTTEPVATDAPRALLADGDQTVWTGRCRGFVVTVDREGLTVRSVLRWPRYRVPLDEVVRADVTHVSPLRDFGGWGWRVGRDGRVGVVLRRGEALQVTRTARRSIVVTVDGAATAAGVLNALVDRSRPRH